MKKISLAVFLLIILAVAAAVFLTGGKKGQGRVCFENNCFDVELAKSPSEQEQGLMFKKSLAPNKGMLFIYKDEANRSFWMKDTLIPLDMIWIGENREVVFISENNQPCINELCPPISPDKNAKYILEVGAWTAKRIGLKVGDLSKLYYEVK
ncbi:MAG: DUF192 domain-containing protein [Candidatus Wildermuthbacteria bacterium]|nr:DUF192 domain-containing protein [Candidatus Wildermuthbacteria bacterium]